MAQPSSSARPDYEKSLLSTSPSIHVQVQDHQPSPAPQPQRSTLSFLLKTTLPWLVAGIGFMFAGISIVGAELLPRIYVCPGGASCSHLSDPVPHAMSLVQSLMNYWLGIGIVLSGTGLTKLVAYQAWLKMKRQGSIIKDLQNTISAMQGSAYDAALLILRRYSRILGLFIAVQITIATAISLVIALSISDIGTHGHAIMKFAYSKNVTMPTLEKIDFTFSTPQRTASNKLDGWLLTGDRSHGGVLNDFQGTFVVPDNRTVYAINPQPGGSRIMGNVSCSGTNMSAVPLEDINRYNITATTGKIYPAPLRRLAAMWLNVYRLSDANTGETLATEIHYIWVSNTTGIIPNATTSTDGKLYAAQCNHTIWTEAIPRVEGMQVIEPSIPFTPLGASIPSSLNLSNNGAMMLSVGNLITAWWRTRTSIDFRPLTCMSGVLAPFDDNGELCRVDSKIWGSTVTAMFDAAVQAGTKSGNATQQLWSRAESISRTKWWWQAAIPVIMLLLYVVCLGYTVRLNREHEDMKELNLCEVVAASHQDDDCVTESMKVGGV